VEYEDAVGVLNGAETMRDDQSSAATEQAVESFADLQLGFGVHAGGGFVEDQEARIVRERTREIDELGRWPTERVEPRSLTSVPTPSGSE